MFSVTEKLGSFQAKLDPLLGLGRDRMASVATSFACLLRDCSCSPQ